MRTVLRVGIAFVILWIGPAPLSAEPERAAPELRKAPAFQAGELLSYQISWSKILTAGEASMAVFREKLPDGTMGFRFVLTGHSTGLVDALFDVDDIVESVFDPAAGHSLSFTVLQKVRKKTRWRSMVFDPDRNTVVSRLNQDLPVTTQTPRPVLDLLSALYAARMIERFEIGTVTIMNVFYSDKNWSVAIQMQGRETVKTAAGEFSTIRLKTVSAPMGASEKSDEAFIWLTDDARKIPVLAKSTIKVGSFIFTLTGFAGVR